MPNKNIQLYLGDSKEVLKQIPDNSVDLICTDPPYGYSFMGKNWDKVVIPTSHWKECLRVLKPGAFAFIMSAPRQDVLSRMIYNLQEAGFETGFSSIYWSYATGFPKASNIGKNIDKRLGVKGKKIKAGGVGFMNENDDGYHTTKHQIIMPERQTKEAKELDGSYGGFQPKPAVEIIIVAMKPLSEKSYIDQALKNGKGITWLDDCRVPYESDSDKSQATPQGKCTSKDVHTGAEPDAGNNEERIKFKRPEQKGRFPANLICSDDVLNDGKIISYGKSKKPYNYKGKKYKVEGFIKDNTPNAPSNYGDSGSYSRYFSLDSWWKERVKKLPPEVQKVFPYLIVPKASKSEKNKGCENLADKTQGQDAKNRVWADKCGNCGLKFIGGEPRCHCPAEKKVTSKKNGYKYKNNHPTVKPIKLMSYLITLGSREKDIVLDPFLGSGTTGISAKLLNRKFIGIEMSEEYIKIASERIKAWNKEDKDNG